MFPILASISLAHPPAQRPVAFPDVPGAVTLVCDLHIHTVFSDGHVWPTVRTWEAEREGLDCIAMTEHLEYQPHAADLPHRDRNRAHQLAVGAVADRDALWVVSGSEITREMPPGHANAIFLTDANRLLKKDPRRVFEEAQRQGAFVFWNHPNWVEHRSDGIARLDEMHEALIRDGLIHGIEVGNDLTFSDEALQIALDRDLTILATSDVHGLVDWQYGLPEGGHRPVTLVFASQRTREALKAALFEGRTVAWFGDTLVGRPESLAPLLQASIHVAGAGYDPGTAVLRVDLENRSSAELILRNVGPHTLHDRAGIVVLAPQGHTTVRIKTGEVKDKVIWPVEVLSALVAPAIHPVVELRIEPAP